MEFKNVKKFKEWLEEKLKYGSYDLSAYLEDVEKQLCETGSSSYELDSFETKSKNSELYDFKVNKNHTVITF